MSNKKILDEMEKNRKEKEEKNVEERRTQTEKGESVETKKVRRQFE